MKSVDEYISEILKKAKKPVDEQALKKRLQKSIDRRNGRLALLKKKKEVRRKEIERLDKKLKPGLDFYYENKDDLYIDSFSTNSKYIVTIGVHDVDKNGKTYIGALCFCSPSDKFSTRTARGLICNRIMNENNVHTIVYKKKTSPCVAISVMVHDLMAEAACGGAGIPSKMAKVAMSKDNLKFYVFC